MTYRATLQKAGEDILNMTTDTDAIYTPNDGPEISCRVRVGHNLDLQPSGYGGQVYGPGITIKALFHILGKEPERGEAFAVGETTYQVEDTRENNGIFIVCSVREVS